MNVVFLAVQPIDLFLFWMDAQSGSWALQVKLGTLP